MEQIKTFDDLRTFVDLFKSEKVKEKIIAMFWAELSRNGGEKWN